jgi:hypothetical protein
MSMEAAVKKRIKESSFWLWSRLVFNRELPISLKGKALSCLRTFSSKTSWLDSASFKEFETQIEQDPLLVQEMAWHVVLREDLDFLKENSLILQKLC